MKVSQIAQEIVDRLAEHSGPAQCGFGEDWPQAHSVLFGFYREDLIQDIYDYFKENIVNGNLDSGFVLDLE